MPLRGGASRTAPPARQKLRRHPSSVLPIGVQLRQSRRARRSKVWLATVAWVGYHKSLLRASVSLFAVKPVDL
jgi:hypothetical protein